jgi:RNA polymerase sigma-70 factor, ECF subfamily
VFRSNLIMPDSNSKEQNEQNRESPSPDCSADSPLFKLVYSELRRLASQYMRQERPGHTLQPTALLHEAYLRLIQQSNGAWKDRAHFTAIAARVMRHVLIDYARQRQVNRKGGQLFRVTLSEGVAADPGPNVDLIALDEALNRLAAIDPRQAAIVELRYIGGLSIEETADALKISPKTVKRDWTVARAWLHREISGRVA